MNITVYLGSMEGNNDIYKNAAAELGTWIGSAGHRLIYGGSRVGLMGVLASAVMRAGGEVIGVEPQFFIEAGVEQIDLTQLIVVQTMSERKAKMIELGEAFIAFPGGVGTLEEISEIMSKERLGHLDYPCILYNVNGFYDPLREMLQRMFDTGFLPAENLAQYKFPETLDAVKKLLGA